MQGLALVTTLMSVFPDNDDDYWIAQQQHKKDSQLNWLSSSVYSDTIFMHTHIPIYKDLEFTIL